jgi:hypothetical protein
MHDNILIYVQQDATLHSIFCLETALHVSGGTATHYQERKQLYLQRLIFVTPLLLPAITAARSSNGVTNTRCCRYSCLRSWWCVAVPPETCRAVSRQNKLCNVASCWAYIRIQLSVVWLWLELKSQIRETNSHFTPELLTLRLLMSCIYGAPILDVSRSHTTTHHSR